MNNLQSFTNRFLNTVNGVPVPSARLTASQAAAFLGFQEHDVPVLTTAKLLRPLGKPATNAVKYFAAVEVCERMGDTGWLHKASQTIYEHWKVKNSRKGKAEMVSEPQTEETSLAA